MKQIKQFRYYGSMSDKNYPALENYQHILANGNLFAQHNGITHLGIQAIPGTRFYLNNSVHSITVGYTGIYELDLQIHGYIHSIRFDPTSLAQYAGGTESDRILIDIIYEGGI